MKISFWILGILLALAATFGLLQYVASERVEVVVVHSNNDAGSTRLWIVDHDGHPYLRAGTPSATWYARVRSNPDVVIERGEQRLQCRGLPRVEKRDEINRLMRQKYTWGDRIISLMISREKAVPVELRCEH